MGKIPWVGKISKRRAWQPTPVCLPGKSHGQRSLMGYSPWGRKELDTTEQLSTHSIWMCYYMVICLLWFPPMISGHQISWHHGSGWKCQYWVDSMAHTTGRWNTAVMDILCFSVDGSTVTTLESLQIHSKRNWKLMSYNQNGKFVCRIPTVSEEDIWVSSE